MIPPELIDPIVSELDTRSLKACALTSSTLCGPSQRALFRSFRLEGVLSSHSYSKTCTLLSDFPHIATYIQHLEIFPIISTPPEELESLQRLLPKLTHVRHCLISGVYTGTLGARWSDFPHGLSSAVLGLISRQGLSSLSVRFMKEIPAPVLLRFLASARSLSFVCCYLRWGPAELSRAGPPPPPPALSHLSLREGAESVGDFLSRRELAPHIATITHLSMNMGINQPTIPILAATAHRLKHLRLNFLGASALYFALSTLIMIPRL